MARGVCHCGQKQQKNGNCPVCRDEDDQVVQCVGPWSAEKHQLLAKYIGATWSTRAKFSKGGCAYLDLFSGPGKAKLTSTGAILDGSPLIALKHAGAPFSKVILGENDEENLAALEYRATAYGSRVAIVPGDSNANIHEMVKHVPERGLNLALVDPFGANALRFDTLAALAQFERMDLIIHFPTVAIKRNQDVVDYDAIVGSDGWKTEQGNLTQQLVNSLKRNLSRLGYTGSGIRDWVAKNSKNGVLYHLIFASKHELGDKIWSSVTSIDARGQRSLFST